MLSSAIYKYYVYTGNANFLQIKLLSYPNSLTKLSHLRVVTENEKWGCRFLHSLYAPQVLYIYKTQRFGNVYRYMSWAAQLSRSKMQNKFNLNAGFHNRCLLIRLHGNPRFCNMTIRVDMSMNHCRGGGCHRRQVPHTLLSCLLLLDCLYPNTGNHFWRASKAIQEYLTCNRNICHLFIQWTDIHKYHTKG